MKDHKDDKDESESDGGSPSAAQKFDASDEASLLEITPPTEEDQD